MELYKIKSLIRLQTLIWHYGPTGLLSGVDWDTCFLRYYYAYNISCTVS